MEISLMPLQYNFYYLWIHMLNDFFNRIFTGQQKERDEHFTVVCARKMENVVSLRTTD